MSEKYMKKCIESNSDYSVYYGAGKYLIEEQSALHYDINYTVSYFIHCSGNINIEGNTYPIKSGDVIITHPGEIHCCNIDDHTFHERISVCINKLILKNFMIDASELFDFFENREKGFGNVIQAETAAVFRLGNLMEDIYELSKNKSDKNRILCICKITELLVQLGNALSGNTLSSGASNNENPMVSNAIKYINEHFTEDFNCEEIAEKLFISKYRLEHIFKESLGISLWDYVIIKRLMLVNELMQKNYPVKEASYISGFHNYSNFYRLYKKHFHISPSEHKKMLNKSLF